MILSIIKVMKGICKNAKQKAHEGKRQDKT